MVKMKSFLISDGTAKYLSYLKITFAESVHSMKILTGLVHTTSNTFPNADVQWFIP